jgi:tRNA 2-thiouridine synthesizing protein A
MEAMLRRMAPGARLRIAADDPLAAIDIPHFAAEGGHACERVEEAGALCVFLVTRGEKP